MELSIPLIRDILELLPEALLHDLERIHCLSHAQGLRKDTGKRTSMETWCLQLRR